MRLRLLLCCIVSCLVVSRVQAVTFYVTTTADNGAGSLRQAILDAAANGVNTSDFISFNIPQTIFNQRIIYLASPLPPLTSNLIIDGSTQPGEKFAVTDAKICIMKDDYAPDFTLFNITNAQNVSIFGLYMVYGYQAGIFNPPYRSELLYAISLSNAFNIEIGAPGKGNVINGYDYGIYSFSDSCRNIRIQSNYIGQGLYYTDVSRDIAPVVLPVVAAIHMINAKDVLIGGATPAEGNVIKANRAIGLNASTTNCGFIRIENNVIGKFYDRTTVLGGGDIHCPTCLNVHIGHNQYLGPTTFPKLDYDVSIINNDIPTSLGVDRLGNRFFIKGNKFVIPAAAAVYTSTEAKLIISNCESGIIGGPATAEANTFQHGGSLGIYAIAAYENVAVQISENVFECNQKFGSPIVVTSNRTLVPFVRIDQRTATQVSGIATPNCNIELFYDDDCTACEGRVFLGSTTSDALGNWSFTGPITGGVVATATTGLGATGEFSVPEADISNVVYTYPACGQSNGSITGIQIVGGNGGMWRDLNGNVVSNSVDLLNARAGSYIFFAKLGDNCMRFGGFFELKNASTVIADTTYKILTNPSCGRNNGSIERIALYPFTHGVIEWQNDRGQIIPGGEFSAPFAAVRNLYPGRYRLFIRDTTGNGCNDSTFFYELTNPFGPALDTNSVVISPATCGATNGSITNLTLTQMANDPFLEWIDSLNRRVGNSLDLVNQPPGKYRLKFRDASGCDTTYTPEFIIPEVKMQLDSSQLLITKSGCMQNNGSIRGMLSAGASRYRWTNTANGNVVGNAADLLNVAPGTYQLEAFTNGGCSVQSNLYTITVADPPTIAVTNVSVRMAHCNQDNGFIQINGFNDNPAFFTFHWLRDSVTNLGMGSQVGNIGPGRYQLIATDTNGCQKQVYAATITQLPMPSIDVRQLMIAPDTCERSVGSITGVAVRDADGPQYKWLNATTQEVGQQITLRNIPAGQYYLEVTDALQCMITSPVFTVGNISKQLAPPVYTNITVPKGLPFFLEPAVAGAGNYIIYDVQVGGTALQQSGTGRFELPGMQNDATYYIEFQQGNCSSTRVPVEVKVVDESRVLLPNAFSPNGDGLNDTWGIQVFGIIKLGVLRVFNRWGQVVFETTDPARRWNGTINGTPLPIGTYYYVLKAVDHLGKPISQNGPVLILR